MGDFLTNRRLEQQRRFNLYLLGQLEGIVDLQQRMEALSRDQQTLHRDLQTIQEHFHRAIQELQKEVEKLRDHTVPQLVKREEEVWQAIDEKAEWALGVSRHLLTVLKEKEPLPQEAKEALREVTFCEGFRGKKEGIKDTLIPYLDVIKESPVLDLGFGRGEWLELLKEKGWEAVGLEQNDIWVKEAKQKGFTVHKADALAWLSQQEDQIFGAITAFHFLEHLPPSYAWELFKEIHRTLKPGGIFLGELPNVTSLCAFFNFFKDPDHKTFWHPETLQYYMENAGFSVIQIQGCHPFPEMEETTPSLPSELGSFYEKWKTVFWGFQDLTFQAKKEE